MVAEAHVVAGEAEDVPDAQDGGAEDVGLHGEAVPVAAGHLHDGLEAVLLGLMAGDHRADAHHGGLVVGDVDGVDVALEQVGLAGDDAAIGALRRSTLAGDGERARGEDLFEVAAGLQRG